MNREERLGQAGEFVLGVMDDRERLEFEMALDADAELRRTVDRLANRLHALDAYVMPASVPPGLWPAIEEKLDDSAREQPRLPVSPSNVIPMPDRVDRRRSWLAAPVLGTLAACLLVALGLGYFAGAGLLGRAEPVAIAVLLDQEGGAPGAIVAAYGDDSVTVSPLRAFEVPEGKIMQVWTLPDQQTGPVSLGTLARTAAATLNGPDLPQPKDGQLYEITLEPEPGSPTGRPTGPILVKGFAALTSGRL